MTVATKRQTARQEKGLDLQAAGAVEVIEEYLRESASAYCAPKVGGGRYSVEGSGGVYEMTVDAPVLGAPKITCTCEDYRRGNAPNGRCKHAYAVYEHIRLTNIDMAARLEAVRGRASVGIGAVPAA